VRNGVETPIAIAWRRADDMWRGRLRIDDASSPLESVARDRDSVHFEFQAPRFDGPSPSGSMTGSVSGRVGGLFRADATGIAGASARRLSDPNRVAGTLECPLGFLRSALLSLGRRRQPNRPFRDRLEREQQSTSAWGRRGLAVSLDTSTKSSLDSFKRSGRDFEDLSPVFRGHHRQSDVPDVVAEGDRKGTAKVERAMKDSSASRHRFRASASARDRSRQGALPARTS